VGKAGRKLSRYLDEILIRGRRITIGGRPLVFDLEEGALFDLRELLQARRGQALPKKRAYLKWQQEEVLRRVCRLYPDGNIPRTAEVQRAISDRKFQPAYNTVHDALGRRPKK
jgi:hypothetical protein